MSFQSYLDAVEQKTGLTPRQLVAIAQEKGLAAPGVKAGEILACTLCTLHNLHFYLHLMAQARTHIEAGDYGTWHRAWVERYETGAAAR